MIEHYFDKVVLQTKLGAKSFSFSNEFNSATEYGKRLFAEHVIKKNEANINFDGFKQLLNSIDAVISDHKLH